MATSNRRVAAYLPPEIDEAFIAFKIQRELATEEEPNQNDSQGLIQILSEFLGVSRGTEYLVSYPADAVTQGQLDSLKSELVSQISELSSELCLTQGRLQALIDASVKTVSNKELAQFIGIGASTLSEWKKEK